MSKNPELTQKKMRLHEGILTRMLKDAREPLPASTKGSDAPIDLKFAGGVFQMMLKMLVENSSR